MNWEKGLEEIVNKIFKYYKDLESEMDIINKKEDSIIKEEIKLPDEENKISFYDLLTFLKNGVIPKKVSLNIGDEDHAYIYDGEANYVLENEIKNNDIFAMHLSDSLTDLNKLEKRLLY